jgi:hypothetical protein
LGFFSPHFSQVARGLSILFIFSKNQLFVSLICCMVFVFVVSISLISAVIFMISLLLVLGFACSCFSRI